jgi:hypothetical protein
MRGRPDMRYLLLLSLLLGGCAGKRVAVDTPKAPDMGGVMAAVGRFTMGSACPVGPDLILSAAHLTDLRPFDPEAGLIPYPWSNDAGESGLMVPVRIMSVHDLAQFVPVDPMVRYYRIATEAPKIGETLWWQEYCFDSKKCAFERENKSSVVTRLISGHVILKEELEGGASGSCVLNARSEVVGVVSFGKPLNFLAGEVGGVVAVYGDWLNAQDRVYERRLKWDAEQLAKRLLGANQ